MAGWLAKDDGNPLNAQVFVLGTKQPVAANPDGNLLVQNIAVGEQSLVVIIIV
jgi:hypothetical protein